MSGRLWRNILSYKSAPTSNVTAPKRRTRRGREKRFKAEAVKLTVESALPLDDEPAQDPVRLAVLAMETLGPASMRASCGGMPVEVLVPDDAIAAIFRAVLAETSRKRPTDRLIRVAVE